MSSSSNTANDNIDSKGNINIVEKEDTIDRLKIDSSKLATSKLDPSEKIVNLIDSPKVQSIRESGKEYIDIDIKSLEEGKFYQVIYHGDTYCIEKLSDGQIAFYEVID